MARKEDLAVVVRANVDPLGADLRRGVAMVNSFLRDVDRVSPRAKFADDSTRTFRESARAAAAARSSFRSAAAEGMSFAKSTAAVAAGFLAVEAGGLGLAGAFRQLKSSVFLAAELEQNTIAFEVMLKSGEAARSMLADLRKFAAQTPFSQRQSVDAAKQLLAYGTAADQVIPTLRMLGHFSALDPQRMPLADLTYIFGTLRTQGRMYTRDLNQFLTRGVDLLPELAKELNVTTQQVRALVEEGRVDFNVVQRAMENMTMRGGRFFGLLDKQAESLTGRWEQMKDAFDFAKMKFGQIVIREVGLKDALRDSEAFFRSLDSGMEKVAPAVRWLGQLGRAVVHVGYEFGKAGLQSGGIFGEMAREVPQLQRTFSAIDDIIKGMSEFKLKPDDVARFAIEGSKEVLSITGSFVSFVGELGDVFKTKILDPTVRAIDFIGETTGKIEFGADVWKEFRARMSPAVALRDLGERIGVVDRAERPGSELIHPAIRGDSQGQDALRTTFESLRDFGNKVKTINARLDQAGNRILERLQQDERREQLAKETAALSTRRKEMEAAVTMAKMWRGGMAGELMGIGPSSLHALAAGGAGFQAESRLLTGMRAAFGMVPQVGGFLASGFGTTAGPSRLRGDDLPPAHLAEWARNIKGEFNPFAELMRKKGDIDNAVGLGLLTPQQGAFAFGRETRTVAEGLGLGGAPKLPGAAIVGSAEDARLLAMFKAGGSSQQDVPALLRQILHVLQQSGRYTADVAQSDLVRAGLAVVSIPGK